MGKKINNNGGFSLIELLVGLAISCIVLAAAYSFVLSGISSYDRTRKTTELQQETQFIENIIVDAVENGTASSSSINDTSDKVEFDTGYQVLYFDRKSNVLALYDKNKTPPDDSPGVNINEHIVSKKVTNFVVEYINIEPETDSAKKQIEKATGITKLVKVEVTVAMNGKTDSSAKQYTFRNE